MLTQILQRIEGSAPNHTSAQEGQRHRAEHGKQKQAHRQRIRQHICRRNARDLAAGDVDSRNAGIQNDGSRARPAANPQCRKREDDLNRKSKASEERQPGLVAIQREEVLFEVADDAPGSLRPANGGKTRPKRKSLPIPGPLELSAAVFQLCPLCVQKGQLVSTGPIGKTPHHTVLVYTGDRHGAVELLRVAA